MDARTRYEQLRAESSLITIDPVTAQNVGLFKTVRLRALQDAPYAFSATYAKESHFDESEWLRRVDRMNGERGIGFLAMDCEIACGIVGAFVDANDATQAQLVSMWTAPTHRQRGVGRLLVHEVLGWARRRGARTLLLMVTSNNELQCASTKSSDSRAPGGQSLIQTIPPSSNTKCRGRFEGS